MTASTQGRDECVRIARATAERVHKAIEQYRNGIECAETELSTIFDGEYGVDFVIGSGCEGLYYRGVRIMVAGGGPNVYVDTFSGEVEVYWWADSATYSLDSEDVNWLDEYWRECVLGQTVRD